MPQQVGQPFGIADIGLAPGHVPHVAGIRHPDREERLEDVVNRLPEHATNNVAKNLLNWEFVITIPRAQLRPADRLAAALAPRRAEGGPDGSSQIHSQFGSDATGDGDV
jgi:hypothetical protein